LRKPLNKQGNLNAWYSDVQQEHFSHDNGYNHFRSIVEKVPIGVSINRNGKILFANQAYAKMFGLNSCDELVNKPVLAQVVPKFRDEIADIIRLSARSEQLPIARETVGLRSDGTVLPMLVQVDRVVLPDGPAEVIFYTDYTAYIGSNRMVEQTAKDVEKSTGEGEQIFLDIASALETALDIREPYTAEHQKKVGRLARAIAEEMGFPEDKIEGIEIAGKLHDIGKIKVPIEILNKSGKLSGLEFEIIKTHSQVGYNIIKNIDFPWPIGEIILQHHERMDGSGYPRGLKGEEILVEAQILAVADVVEAMSSHRPYRPALGIDAALEEIEKHTGTLYRTEVADACLSLFREKRFSFD